MCDPGQNHFPHHLLLSDNFQTLIFATIANRDPKKLAEGRIDVFFQDATSEDLSVQQTFVMVESSSYFEAYRHVLRSLQQVTETNMPFQKYIGGERRGDIDHCNRWKNKS